MLPHYALQSLMSCHGLGYNVEPQMYALGCEEIMESAGTTLKVDLHICYLGMQNLLAHHGLWDNAEPQISNRCPRHQRKHVTCQANSSPSVFPPSLQDLMSHYGLHDDSEPQRMCYDKYVEKARVTANLTLNVDSVCFLQALMSHYGLRDDSEPQTYALGIKEVWEVPEDQHKPGLVIHTVGYPLDNGTYGGGWIYHMDNRCASWLNRLPIGVEYT